MSQQITVLASQKLETQITKNNCHKHRFKEMVWWYRNYSFIVFFICKNSAQYTRNHKLGTGLAHTAGRVQLCWMPRTGDQICASCKWSESLRTRKHTLTFKQPEMHEARHPDRHENTNAWHHLSQLKYKNKHWCVADKAENHSKKVRMWKPEGIRTPIHPFSITACPALQLGLEPVPGVIGRILGGSTLDELPVYGRSNVERQTSTLASTP